MNRGEQYQSRPPARRRTDLSVQCPICGIDIAESEINIHLDQVCCRAPESSTRSIPTAKRDEYQQGRSSIDLTLDDGDIPASSSRSATGIAPVFNLKRKQPDSGGDQHKTPVDIPPSATSLPEKKARINPLIAAQPYVQHTPSLLNMS